MHADENLDCRFCIVGWSCRGNLASAGTLRWLADFPTNNASFFENPRTLVAKRRLVSPKRSRARKPTDVDFRAIVVRIIFRLYSTVWIAFSLKLDPVCLELIVEKKRKVIRGGSSVGRVAMVKMCNMKCHWQRS